MKITLFLPILILVQSCSNHTSYETKIIDTEKFEMEVPIDWQYETIQGDDSFLGKIKGPGIDLIFDWSELGYAGLPISNDNTINYKKEVELLSRRLPPNTDGVINSSESEQAINDTVNATVLESRKNVIKYQVSVDTIANYSRKLVRPRNGKVGLTAILFEDLKSAFNFSIIGEDISIENQEKVIVSFKSIKLKRIRN